MVDNSKAVMEAVQWKAMAALANVAASVAASARQIVLVDTGDLRASIGVRQKGLVAAIGSDTHYAAYVEAGTPKMAAQPYLRPALMANLHEIKKVFKAV